MNPLASLAILMTAILLIAALFALALYTSLDPYDTTITNDEQLPDPSNLFRESDINPYTKTP